MSPVNHRGLHQGYLLYAWMWMIAKLSSMDVVLWHVVYTLLLNGVTSCCFIDFGFAIFPSFMLPVVIAFLCCLLFIKCTSWLFHMLWCEYCFNNNTLVSWFSSFIFYVECMFYWTYNHVYCWSSSAKQNKQNVKTCLCQIFPTCYSFIWCEVFREPRYTQYVFLVLSRTNTIKKDELMLHDLM